MRNDIMLKSWDIECKSTAWDEDFHESVFFAGNGRVGIRGYLPCGSEKRPQKAGLYIAGIFERINGGITDIVHLPTPVLEDALICGSTLQVQGAVIRYLDLHSGIFRASYRLASEEAALDAIYERFAALDNTGCILQKTTLTAKSDISFEWRTGISLAPRNNPVPDDQVKNNEEILCLFDENTPVFQDNRFNIEVYTPQTGLRIQYDCSIRSGQSGKAFYNPGERAGFSYSIALKAGESICIEKLCFITTSRDLDPSIQKPVFCDYNGFLARHKEKWVNRWSTIELPLLPEMEMTTAARYIAAQLVMNGPANDETVSIGARGLTHPRYKGCYFWDTDFFLIPFFQQTHLQTARNLVRYRIRNLPAAKAHALKTSVKGARYPWMTSFDGSEQCESWDIGLAEVHVTADVVYAIDQYIKYSGDIALYPEAAVVYIETARFWADRCTRDTSGKANLLFVKGPDEYCGITNNNLFTNTLVKHNLKLACEAVGYLEQNAPEQYAKMEITVAEIASWEALANDLPIARDPFGNLQQDDTFHLLKPADPAMLKSGDGASYHKVSFDSLQRYKVIKQADLILLMTRFPEKFSAEEKRQAWLDYAPVCLHDSTLSFASHALFAMQNDYTDSADFFLRKALFLDLRDVMGNTGKEGLHLANYGECWQALVASRWNLKPVSV